MYAEPIVTPLTDAQRRAVLVREIAGRVSKGYRLVTQTDTTAQMVLPKKFSGFWAFCWLLVGGVGIIVYLLYYASKRDEQRFLSVDEAGQLTILAQDGEQVKSILA